MKTPHIIITLLALLLASCSSSTYRTNADGTVTYHVGNLADKTAFDLHAMTTPGSDPSTISKPTPIFDSEGTLVAVGQTTITIPSGGSWRLQEDRDGTEVPLRGITTWGAVASLKEWVRGDVAKATEAEKTTRTGIEATAGVETERLKQVGGATGALTNPESSGAGVGVVGDLLKR